MGQFRQARQLHDESRETLGERMWHVIKAVIHSRVAAVDVPHDLFQRFAAKKLQALAPQP